MTVRRREEPHSEVERIVPGTALWAAHYEEHVQRYAFAARWLGAGRRVLDAGCGVGYGAALIADRGASAVIAVDRSEDALDIGRATFDRPGITWIAEDCHELVASARHAPFDLICNLENLEHLAEPSRFLRRAADLMSPDGVLVTSTPNRIGANRLRGLPSNAASPNPYHSKEYTNDEFRTLLEGHFSEIALHYQTLDPLERMQIEPVLRALWRDPFLRAGRWLRRILTRRATPELDELLPPVRYQILSEDPGDALVVTQLAVCHRPRGR